MGIFIEGINLEVYRGLCGSDIEGIQSFVAGFCLSTPADLSKFHPCGVALQQKFRISVRHLLRHLTTEAEGSNSLCGLRVLLHKTAASAASREVLWDESSTERVEVCQCLPFFIASY